MNHHNLSMSNWVKWESCPCATSSPTTSAEAEAGTRSHAHLENLIHEAQGLAVHDVENLTSDERARAEWAFTTIDRISKGYPIHSETRVEIKSHAYIPECLVGISGTCDAWVLDTDALEFHVFDYKTFSMGETDYSAQVGGYALALITEGDYFENFKIKLYTLNGGSRTVSVAETRVDDIIERSERIIESRLRDSENFEKAACNKFCKYCVHAKSCPAADRAIATVKDTSIFSGLSLAKQMVICKEVKAICDRVEKDVKAILDDLAQKGGLEAAVLSDGEITWRYKEKAGAGVLSDVAGLAEACASNGVGAEALMECAKFSKTAVCDKLIACNAGMKAVAAKRIVEPFYTAGKPSRILERVG